MKNTVILPKQSLTDSNCRDSDESTGALEQHREVDLATEPKSLKIRPAGLTVRNCSGLSEHRIRWKLFYDLMAPL